MRLAFVQTLVGSFSFIESDIYKEGPSRHEWKQVQCDGSSYRALFMNYASCSDQVRSTDDPRVMGTWNVRCRTIAIVQGLGYYRTQDLHGVYMRWVRESAVE